MALQAKISLEREITEPQSKLYRIPILMTVIDDEEVLEPDQEPTILFDGHYVVKYKQGTDVVEKVEGARAYFQERIDSWKRCQNIENSPALANALAAIENGLEV